jgi:hypothetical protein
MELNRKQFLRVNSASPRSKPAACLSNGKQAALNLTVFHSFSSTLHTVDHCLGDLQRMAGKNKAILFVHLAETTS